MFDIEKIGYGRKTNARGVFEGYYANANARRGESLILESLEQISRFDTAR